MDVGSNTSGSECVQLPMQPPRRPSLAGEVAGTLGSWISAQLKICGILCLIYAIGFAACKVPGWWVLALICGALQMIPIVGAVSALILPLAVAWLNDSGIYVLLGALVTVVIAQGLEGFYLTPKIMGRRLRLPPVVVFLAVLIGGAMFGFFGILFAAPVLAVLMVLWRRARST